MQQKPNQRMAHFDCHSGVSGDMLLGALVDVGVPLEAMRDALAMLPIDGYELRAEKVTRGGLAATQVTVTLDENQEHPHRGLSDVLEIINAGKLEPRVAERTSAVFRRLAEAEAKVHDTTPDEVHFHEVGAIDAICDITGTVFGLNYLEVADISFGTIALGGGTIEAAHGTLPVPPPAVVELLRDVPTRGGPVDCELTTPTGAAVLSTIGSHRDYWPEIRLEKTGYGAGSRELESVPNILRLALGAPAAEAGDETDSVWVVEVNIDDMTGEEVGFCMEELLAAGALDVFTTPIQMKKNRPGVRLSVICAQQDLDDIERVFWQQTTTLGIRRHLVRRSKLRRQIQTVETPWGEVRVKFALSGGEVVRREPEYDDCARLARANNLALREVYRTARRAADQL